MDFLLFALLNAVAACNAAIIARRLRTDAESAADVVLSGAAIFCFQIVFTSILLGHFGKLFVYNMLAAQMLLLFAAVVPLALNGARRSRRPTAARRRKTDEEERPNRLALLPAAACFAGLAALFVYCAVSPPPPTDAFLYHLVFPAEWLKSGRISIVQTLSADQASPYYPANAELLYLWLMLPFHDDIAARFLQWVFAAVCVTCCWGIARRTGLNKTAAAAAAAATLLTPGFFRQAANCDVDIVFAAFFLMAVFFLMEEGLRGFVLSGLAAGLMAGTKTIGILYLILLLPIVISAARKEGGGRGGFFGAALTWAVFAAVAGGYWYLRNLYATGSPFYPLGVSLGGWNIFPGAYGREAMVGSYLHLDTRQFEKLFLILREYVFGIPLLVSAAAVGVAGLVGRGRRTPPQISARDGRTAYVGALQPSSKRFFFSDRLEACPTTAKQNVFSGTGFQPVENGLPVFKKRNEFIVTYLFCLPVLATLLFWFVNPYNTPNNYRFLLPALFFFYLLILNAFKNKGIINHLFPIVLVCGAAAGVYLDDDCMLILLYDKFAMFEALLKTNDPAALAAFFVLCLLSVIVFRKKTFIRTSAIAISIVTLFLLFSARADYLQASRYDWYAGHYLGAGWKALEENAPGPARVAYIGNPAPYGLYGNGLKNDVIYVNLDGSDRKFHDYEMERRAKNGGAPFIKDAMGLDYVYRSNQDFNGWRGALIRKKVDYLFVSKQFFRGRIEMPVEGEWALTHPEIFRQVFHQGDVWIFRISGLGSRVSGSG